MRAIAVLAAVVGALALAAPLALAGPASAVTLFENPRHNIGCAIWKSGARCDVRKREWEPPPKPDWCEVDWGNGLEVGRRGVARFVCAGDTVLGQGRRLAYGDAIRRGRFRCVSRQSGMRCVNRRNGHGFKISKQRAQLF